MKEYENAPADTDADAVAPTAAQPPATTTSGHALLTLSLEGSLARAVQTRSAHLGVSVEDVVREAVEEMLKREQAARDRQSQRTQPHVRQILIPVACGDATTENVHALGVDLPYKWERDMVAVGTKQGGRLYALLLQEMKTGNDTSHKHVLLRECSPDHIDRHGDWVAGASFLLPVGKLNWLIEALERAKQVLDDEAQANRSAVQQARQSRAPEVVDEEDLQQKAWTEKRGREAWNRAVTLAGRQRGRARNRTQHFEAWEWLELCERFGFRCPVCGIAEGNLHPGQVRAGLLRTRTGGIVHLQPHHRRKLSEAGENTIENILPLCGDCHTDIHDQFSAHIETMPNWLDAERANCDRLLAGMLVVRRQDVQKEYLYRGFASQAEEADGAGSASLGYPPRWPVGAIVAVTMPERVDGALGANFIGRLPYGTHFGLVVNSDQVSFWHAGTAEVKWMSTLEGAPNARSDASRLSPVDKESARRFRERWAQEQWRDLAAFGLGDVVRPKGSRQTHRSQIVEILPPDPILLRPARAVIVNRAKPVEEQIIEFTKLVKASIL